MSTKPKFDKNIDKVSITNPIDNQYLIFDYGTLEWVNYTPIVVKQIIFTVNGELTVNTGNIRIPNITGTTLTITKVRIDVNTAPTGNSIIVDVNKDGTTIFTTQANRPEIAIGEYYDQTTTIDVANWVDGGYLTVDIDQVGSAYPGADLTITIKIEGALL